MNKDSLRRTITLMSEYRAVAPEEKKEELLELINEMIMEYNSLARKNRSR